MLGHVSSGVRFAQFTLGDHGDQVLSGGHDLERGEIIKTPHTVVIKRSRDTLCSR